jgi:hypothetical protein
MNKFLITSELNGDDRFSLHYAGYSESEMTEDEHTERLNINPDEFLDDAHDEYGMYEDLEGDDDYWVNINVNKLTSEELEDVSYMAWFNTLASYNLDNLCFENKG